MEIHEAGAAPAAEPGTFHTGAEFDPVPLAVLDALPGSGVRWGFRARNLRTERLVGAVPSKGSPVHVVAGRLARAIATWDGEPLDADDQRAMAAQAARLLALPYGDVLTLTIAWQATVGHVDVSLPCPECGGTHAHRVPLSEIPVPVPRDRAALVAEVGLRVPVGTAAGPIRALRLRSPSYGALYRSLRADGATNNAQIMADGIADAVIATDLPAVVRLAPAHVDDLSAADVRTIEQALAVISPQVSATVELASPCGRVASYPLSAFAGVF